jgi:hypothetical protein
MRSLVRSLAKIAGVQADQARDRGFDIMGGGEIITVRCLFVCEITIFYNSEDMVSRVVQVKERCMEDMRLKLMILGVSEVHRQHS